MIKMAIHLKTSDVKFVITKMTMILTDKLLLNKTFVLLTGEDTQRTPVSMRRMKFKVTGPQSVVVV